MKCLFLIGIFVALLPLQSAPLFNMAEMLDASTLEVKVLKDWHVVRGEVSTRQKLVTIRVGELLPGKEYRVPVRMVVPANRKAKGFHLTGGHNPGQFQKDLQPRGVDRTLLAGGVGLVQTVVQVLQVSGQGELGRLADRRFVETLNPHYSIQYWGWPATLMRATTTAYAEKDHFEKGKVAASGGSKNGASPSVALIEDKRLSALHASVSPIWDSPLRLCDPKAWSDLRRANETYAVKLRARGEPVNTERIMNHFFLGGTFGPVYNRQALAAGNKWEDLQKIAGEMADHVFVSRHLKTLKERNVDLFFHPGTHDFVAFDLAWGGKHHPQIPIYLKANSGHGIRELHPAAERDEQNKSVFLLHHFFGGEGLLPPPAVQAKVDEDKIQITVTFPKGAKAESGRIWWMYDRGPDGSAAYIAELFPKEQAAPMKMNPVQNSWSVTLVMKPGHKYIDIFSNHRKRIVRSGRTYNTYISSPYTRLPLQR
jgi:hypothetical protein